MDEVALIMYSEWTPAGRVGRTTLETPYIENARTTPLRDSKVVGL